MVDRLFTAIVLAGDRPGDTLAATAGVARKALIRVGNTTMLEHVVDVAMHSPYVGRVLVVANRVEDIRPAVAHIAGAERLEFVEGAETPVTSLMVAMTSVGSGAPLLVAAADMPLLPAEAFDQFCRAAAESTDADVVAALIVERDVREAFPYMKRTFIHLRDVGFKGCNLFALLTPVASGVVGEWVSIERQRKQPVRFLLHFGLWTAWRAYRGDLSLTEALDHVSRRFGVRVEAVLMHDARLAIDVDLPEHLQLARAVRRVERRPWPRHRVAFLFSRATSRQVAHSATIAKEMIARYPEIEVAVITTSAGQWDTARAALGSEMERCRILVSATPAWQRVLEWLFGGLPSVGRVLNLLRLKRQLTRFDAIVVPERASLLLKAPLGSRAPKLIFVPDGSGDGSEGSGAMVSRFDLALPSGEKSELTDIPLPVRASAAIVRFLEESLQPRDRRGRLAVTKPAQ